jgi:hypothetical protein
MLLYASGCQRYARDSLRARWPDAELAQCRTCMSLAKVLRGSFPRDQELEAGFSLSCDALRTLLVLSHAGHSDRSQVVIERHRCFLLDTNWTLTARVPCMELHFRMSSHLHSAEKGNGPVEQP